MCDEINLSFLIPPGRREDSEDAGSLPDRLTVTSTLRFRPRSGDNSEKIACEAQHPALTREPLRASVKMFVQCKLLMTAMISIYLSQIFFVFRSSRTSSDLWLHKQTGSQERGDRHPRLHLQRGKPAGHRDLVQEWPPSRLFLHNRPKWV